MTPYQRLRLMTSAGLYILAIMALVCGATGVAGLCVVGLVLLPLLATADVDIEVAATAELSSCPCDAASAAPPSSPRPQGPILPLFDHSPKD